MKILFQAKPYLCHHHHLGSLWFSSNSLKWHQALNTPRVNRSHFISRAASVTALFLWVLLDFEATYAGNKVQETWVQQFVGLCFVCVWHLKLPCLPSYTVGWLRLQYISYILLFVSMPLIHAPLKFWIYKLMRFLNQILTNKKKVYFHFLRQLVPFFLCNNVQPVLCLSRIFKILLH